MLNGQRESGSSRFQPGEGPSRGLPRDYEPSDGTFWSTKYYTNTNLHPSEWCRGSQCNVTVKAAQYAVLPTQCISLTLEFVLTISTIYAMASTSYLRYNIYAVISTWYLRYDIYRAAQDDGLPGLRGQRHAAADHGQQAGTHTVDIYISTGCLYKLSTINLVWGPLKCTKSNFNPVHVFLHFK